MNKKNIDVFSNNLRYYMTIKGITRQELADRTKISYFSIRDYEKGNCYAKKDKMKKIAECLEIPIVKLTEEHIKDDIVDIVNNSEDSKLILDIKNIIDNSEDGKFMLDMLIKLSRLDKEGKKYISKTIDMITNDKQ